MPIQNDEQARALATVISCLRPDWDARGIYSVMLRHHREGNELLQRPFADILTACQRKAVQLKSDGTYAAHFPEVLFRDGPHWQSDATPQGGKFIDPETGYDMTAPKQPCPDHPTYNADTCGSCQGDINAGLRPPEYKGLHWDPYDHGLIEP